MYESEILEFKMNMLRAEIEMEAMKAQNQRHNGEVIKYGFDDFMALIEKYRIYDNALPSYRGE
jgi:hypothetical protein